MRVASVLNGFPMCDKCAELDKKIEHYRRMLLSIGDQITIERIEALIADLQTTRQPASPPLHLSRCICPKFPCLSLKAASFCKVHNMARRA